MDRYILREKTTIRRETVVRTIEIRDVIGDDLIARFYLPFHYDARRIVESANAAVARLSAPAPGPNPNHPFVKGR